MLAYSLKKLKIYLLILGFSLPIFAFFSAVIEFSAEKKQLKASSQLLSQDEGVGKEKPKSIIIRIDNFPIDSGYVSSLYGMRKDPFSGHTRMHRGIDIAAASGELITPLGKGKVVFVGHKSGYGNAVEILHGRTVITRYAHLKETLVLKDQLVGTEDVIALVGNSGRSTGPHLHLEILINGESIDPQIFLGHKVVSQ